MKVQDAVSLIQRYRIVPKDLFEHVATGGKESSHWFDREEFTSAGIRYLHKKNNAALPGGVSWLCAGNVNLSDQVVHQGIAVSWFCLAVKRRFKLETNEVRALIDDQGVPGNVSYVLEEENDEVVAYRCYVCMRNILGAIEQVRRYYDELKNHGALKPFVQAGQFGLAVLCDTQEKCDSLREALEKKTQGPPLTDLMRVAVSLGPSQRTIAKALAAWREERDDAL